MKDEQYHAHKSGFNPQFEASTELEVDWVGCDQRLFNKFTLEDLVPDNMC